MKLTIITSSPEETIEAARALGNVIAPGDIIAYKGGLGAGKTTFTRGLAIGMGLGDCVSSPTFSLVNEYQGAVTLYHMDMYRIEGEDSLESMGFFDYDLDSGAAAVEWSENISSFLPEKTLYITISAADGENSCKREITMECSGKGAERFASAGDRYIR